MSFPGGRCEWWSYQMLSIVVKVIMCSFYEFDRLGDRVPSPWENHEGWDLSWTNHDNFSFFFSCFSRNTLEKKSVANGLWISIRFLIHKLQGVWDFKQSYWIFLKMILVWLFWLQLEGQKLNPTLQPFWILCSGPLTSAKPSRRHWTATRHWRIC